MADVAQAVTRVPGATGDTTDLALLAERRAGIAALLGTLLLAEPGPELAGLVEGHAELAPLVADPAEAAAEYERVLVRGVQPYESVFVGEDEFADLASVYERQGFDEHDTGRWRVGAVDHLGLQLRCHARMCHSEAVAWRSGTIDAAMEAVEAERTFLAQHLARWGQLAALAIASHASQGPYGALGHAVDQLLAEEGERLRPTPLLGELALPPALPAEFGPARLARLLLSPVSAGTWLQLDTIARAARSISVPWRPSDSRSALRHVIEAAADTGELAVALGPLRRQLAADAAVYSRRAEQEPGNAATWSTWRSRAEATERLLGGIAERNAIAVATVVHRETIVVEAADEAQLDQAVEEALALLRQAGAVARRQGP